MIHGWTVNVMFYTLDPGRTHPDELALVIHADSQPGMSTLKYDVDA